MYVYVYVYVYAIYTYNIEVSGIKDIQEIKGEPKVKFL